MSIGNKIHSFFAKPKSVCEEEVAEISREKKAVETVTISKKHAFFLRELLKSSKGNGRLTEVNVNEILTDLGDLKEEVVDGG